MKFGLYGLKIYQAGDVFRLPLHGGVYMLCRTGSKEMALIGLASGNRWRNPITTSEFCEATEAEFAVICGDGVTFIPISRQEVFK